MQIAFKNKTRLGNNFHFKNQIPKDLTSGVAYKFQCGLCNKSYYDECMRHLNVRIGEHIGLSPLTRKQVKPKNSSVAYHLLLFSHSTSYDNFSILTRENKKFLPELKGSLWIMRDKLSLNTLHKTFPLKICSVNMTKSAKNCAVVVTLHRHYCTYSTGPTYKIFIRILFVLIVATLFLLNGLFYYYLVMCKVYEDHCSP